MNIIQISAAELAPGDDNNGDILATVDVQGAKTYLTYEGDDTRIRVASSQVYIVKREGGISTVEDKSATPAERPDWIAIEAEAGARRERELQLSFRRGRRFAW
jgi:hypothetical protein